MTKSKWDPVPKEYIPSTVRPISTVTDTSNYWWGVFCIFFGAVGVAGVSFVGGIMIGRGM